MTVHHLVYKRWSRFSFCSHINSNILCDKMRVIYHAILFRYSPILYMRSFALSKWNLVYYDAWAHWIWGTIVFFWFVFGCFFVIRGIGFSCVKTRIRPNKAWKRDFNFQAWAWIFLIWHENAKIDIWNRDSKPIFFVIPTWKLLPESIWKPLRINKSVRVYRIVLIYHSWYDLCC